MAEKNPDPKTAQWGRDIGQVFAAAIALLVCLAVLAPFVWLVRSLWEWALA
jgi:hypothetical protein